MIADKIQKIIQGKELKKTVTIEGEDFILRIPSFMEEMTISRKQKEFLDKLGFTDSDNAPLDAAISTQALATFETVLEGGKNLLDSIKDLPSPVVFGKFLLPLWMAYQELRKSITLETDSEIKN